MAHSYICCYLHCVFSTKGREALIVPRIRDRLWAYMGGVARDKKVTAVAIGGFEDHAHMLVSMPATLTVSAAMQAIKGASSAWMNEQPENRRRFAWQEGYSAFSVSVSMLGRTVAYIQRQAEHHRKMTYQDELRTLLKRHGIPYDERYVWG